MRTWIAIGLMAALLGGAVAPASGAEHCAPIVDRKLAGLGIDPSDITGIDYGSETSSGEGAELIAVRAWVKLKSCAGHLVVDMTPSCRVVQTFTRRQCRIQGVAHY